MGAVPSYTEAGIGRSTLMAMDCVAGITDWESSLLHPILDLLHAVNLTHKSSNLSAFFICVYLRLSAVLNLKSVFLQEVYSTARAKKLSR